MKVLALATAAATQSVALVDDDRVLARAALSDGPGCSERVLTLVEGVLRSAGARLIDIDALAVSRGPGALTGLRVGIGTARGLALGSGKPLLGASALRALASALGGGPPILALIDAGRGEVYGGLYAAGSPPRGIGEERVGPPSCFAEALAGREVRIAGETAARYRDLFPTGAWTEAAADACLAVDVGRLSAARLRHPIRGAAIAAGFSREALGADPEGNEWDPNPRYLRRETGPVRFPE